MATDPDEGVSWGDIKLLGAASQEHKDKFSASRAGHSLALIFDNFRLNLQGGEAPLVGHASFAFEVPFELPRRRGLHGFFGALRGGVDQSAGARAVVLAAVGHATKVLTFPYGRSGLGEINRDLATGSEALFSIEGWPSEAEARGAAPPRPPLVVSITVIALRQTVEDAVLAQVDSLDIAAASYDGGGTGQGPPDFEE